MLEGVAGNLQGWVVGCNICQDVCPWNQRFAQETNIPDFQPYPENVAPTLEELVTISGEECDRRFRVSDLRWIKLKVLQRNATVCLQLNRQNGHHT
ncbi:hypothetical protein [Acaryochloris sp. IP29b_bin.148]|uniref:hypothetical protein n=1 Tax=Acaryochloris sp. IP29b_bin.148 TaxID=2969218 RepID=UPI002611F1FC|nr:hypothetical protein [Acaryochloris sp. IP29b_bin.148]